MPSNTPLEIILAKEGIRIGDTFTPIDYPVIYTIGYVGNHDRGLRDRECFYAAK